MKKLKEMSLSIKVFLALVLGVLVGFALQGNVGFANTFIKPFGQLFLNLIRLTIVPLVFSSLVVGVGGMEDITSLGRVGVKTFIYFMFTTAIAIVIGLTLANVLDVGGSFVLSGSEDLVYEAAEAPPLSETLLNIIPSNPIAAMANGDMLQIIVWAIILGIGLLTIGEQGKQVFSLIDALANAMYAITAGIMKLAPLGVFGLIVPVIAENGPNVLGSLARLIFIVYLASAVHIGVIYTLSVKFLGKMSPAKFYKVAFPAWATAFSTSSSSGTLPITMQCAEELGVEKPIASFVLPLGATINMDGTAIYQGVSALFIAQVFGIDLTIGQQVTIVLTATLASIGTAGVPGAGMIMLAMVLESVNLPIEGIALVAGVDRILDMIRTSLNVLGDLSCAIFVSRTDGHHFQGHPTNTADDLQIEEI